MTEPTIDHEARQSAREAHDLARTAIQRLDSHIEEFRRDSDRAQASRSESKAELREIRNLVAALTERVTGSVGRVHQRIDVLTRMALTFIIVLLLAILGAVLMNGLPYDVH